MPRSKFRRQVLHQELWKRAQVFSSTVGHGGWALSDTSSAGSPTAQIENVGGIAAARLLLASDNEAELLDLYLNDVLVYNLRNIRRMVVPLKILNANAVTTIIAGLASARNATADSIAVNAWMRLEGSASAANILCETDDGTTDKDDQDSGVDVSTDWFEFMMDFSGDAAPAGGALKPVKFSINGNRVLEGTNFDLSGVSASQMVQPFFRLQKASGTGTPELCIGPIEIEEAITV